MPNLDLSRRPVLTLADSAQLLRVVVACSLLGICGGVTAGDDELPDAAFLEYLGSWDESDEDWLLVSDVTRVREEIMQDEGSDPAPKGEESMETEDEG
jgi:hypothetical protein